MALSRSILPRFGVNLRLGSRAMISYSPIVRCAVGEGGKKKASARLSQVQQMLHEAQERALSAGNEPIPQITLGNFIISSNCLCFFFTVYWLIIVKCR